MSEREREREGWGGRGGGEREREAGRQIQRHEDKDHAWRVEPHRHVHCCATKMLKPRLSRIGTRVCVCECVGGWVGGGANHKV